MKIDLGPELEQFRGELRDWIDTNRPDGLEDLDERAMYMGGPMQPGPARDAYEEWTAKLADARLICPHWPEPVGGRGLSALQIAVLKEEFSRTRAPRVSRGMGDSPSGSGFNTGYVEGARARRFNVIVGLNNVWRGGMTTLGNERGGGATTQHLRYQREFWDLADETRKRGKADAPLVRQDLAWAFTHT